MKGKTFEFSRDDMNLFSFFDVACRKDTSMSPMNTKVVQTMQNISLASLVHSRALLSSQ